MDNLVFIIWFCNIYDLSTKKLLFCHRLIDKDNCICEICKYGCIIVIIQQDGSTVFEFTVREIFNVQCSTLKFEHIFREKIFNFLGTCFSINFHEIILSLFVF